MGIALVLGTTALAALPSSLSLFTLGLAAWALVPWILLRVLVVRLSDPWVLSTAALGLLLGEAYARATVFLFPRGSTAALLLLFSPLYLGAVVLPAGLALGWLLGTIWRHTRARGRVALVSASVALVALAAVAALRPGLLPAWAARTVSPRERIGPPRVLVGDAFFQKIRISTRQGWYQVGEFDGAPGEEILSIAAGGSVLLDPATGIEKASLPFAASALQRWNWFSRLLRDGAELVIVQTGGGYSEVEVLALDGRSRWRFRPDPDLTPVALLARDLDGDGRLEFYAASRSSVYRLDGEGKVVWEREDKNLVNALDARGADASGAGRLLTVTLPGQLRLWDVEGRVVAHLTLPGDEYRYKLVDWPRPGSIVGGSRAVKVFDPTGHLLFERALGDFRLADAVAVPDGEGGPFLAVLGAAPRDVGLWRLLVFSAAGETVYDEVLARGITLLTALDGAGRRSLLVAGDGLWAYRR
jgi:hypothetical protein